MTRVTERVSRRNEIAAQVEQIERDLGGIRHAMRKPLDAEVSKGELTIPQKAVMQVVVRNPGTSLKDIGCEVSLAHSTVSGIVDRPATESHQYPSSASLCSAS